MTDERDRLTDLGPNEFGQRRDVLRGRVHVSGHGLAIDRFADVVPQGFLEALAGVWLAGYYMDFGQEDTYGLSFVAGLRHLDWL